MDIRPETPRDHQAIHRLTKTAFEPMSFSDGTEADCINSLRDDGDLTLSLVATNDTGVIGHIAFSPAFIDGVSNGWFGLGPVAVWPHLQNRGIGGALIDTGLRQLRRIKASGCVLIGDPEYYSRFEFRSDGGLAYRDLPTKYVQWLAFDGARPFGVLKFSPGLE